MISVGSLFSRSNCAFFGRPMLIAIINCIAIGYVYSQSQIQVRSQLLSAEAPFSFPDKVAIGPKDDVYLLDTNLSSLFVLDGQTSKWNRLCGPDKLPSPSDFTVDRKGNLWVLSAARSKVFKLTSQCDVQTEIISKQLPLRIAANSFGELIVLKGAGHHLFEVYGSDGKLLRSFGQRLEYKDETTNAELSDGRIAPDASGGFYFSFNYPPLIRHYARRGSLIGEFKPESEVLIGPPNVSVRRLGNSTLVSSKYQILVLDMMIDRQGRLYLLLSGKNKIPALNEGTGKLMIVAGTGRLLKTTDLEYNYHGLAANDRLLYLLRNRKPLRLDRYAMF